MSAEITRFRLSTGRECELRACPLPLLPTYHVLSFHTEAPTPMEEDEMLVLAQRSGRLLGRRYYRDQGCFTILFSGRRGRRRAWPHFHIVAVRNVAHKRWSLLLLFAKRFLRWLGASIGRTGARRV